MAAEKKGGFSAEEKAAMKQRAQELKAAQNRETGLKAVEEAIAKLDGLDRELAEKLHALVLNTAPELEPRTWYGFPAYYKGGKNIVFFQPASKFKVRYLTIGFEETAQLDEGTMWPTSYAITAWNAANAKEVERLVRKAVG